MDSGLRTVTFFLKDDQGQPPQRVDSLPSVTLEVEGTDELLSLAEKAFELAGFQPLSYRNILFVNRADPTGARTLAGYLDVAVDEEGFLFWRIGPLSAGTTVIDVERSAAAGLFEGDPHAYSVDRGGYGDGGFTVHWEDLLQLLRDVGELGGGALILRGVARRLVSFLRGKVPWLRIRGARYPDTFLNSIVRRSEWEANHLARLLDADEDEVSDLLIALGYEMGADGVFRYSSDPQTAALRNRLAEQHYLWDGWQGIKRPPTEEEP